MSRRRHCQRGQWGRRGFLAGLAGAAASAPFVSLGTPRAGFEETPTRILLVFSPNGTLPDQWFPTGSGSDYVMGELCEPLERHREQLQFIDGLYVPDIGPGDGHQRGIAGLWTGAPLLEGDDFTAGASTKTVGWGGGISVDQYIANQKPQPTPFPSLEFGAQTGTNNVWGRMVYAGPNAPVSPEDDPYRMFERMFGGADDPVAAAHRRAERRSVLDHVGGDLGRLRDRFGTEHASQLDAHLEGVRQLENRLAQSLPELAECAPTIPPELAWGHNDALPQAIDLQSQLVASAFACDLTRVASLQWTYAHGMHRMTWLGIDTPHHKLTHADPEDPDIRAKLETISLWYSEQFASLLDRLDAIPEGNGTMLDHTMVVWANELSLGATHDTRRLPVVVAGGGGGMLRPGRRLELDPTPISQLLVSICHVAGLTHVEGFGPLDPGNGPLAIW